MEALQTAVQALQTAVQDLGRRLGLNEQLAVQINAMTAEAASQRRNLHDRVAALEAANARWEAEPTEQRRDKHDRRVCENKEKCKR